MSETKGQGSRSKRSEEEEHEEVKLPVPDFDPEAYMKKEVRSAKLAVLNTGYGILLASLAAVAVPLMGGEVRWGWFALLVGVAGLRMVYKLGGVATVEWGAKEWLAAYFTLFFSFLAFWYLFSNPPF